MLVTDIDRPLVREIARPLVIAVANQKGGTGKTTTTINLAAGLRSLGLRVIVVDIDQQANATSGLGVNHEQAAATVYEVLHRIPSERVSISDALVMTDCGVRLLPGSPALVEIESAGDDPGREIRLRRALQTIEMPHVVLIDCPPNLGRCTTIALVAADVVLAPVKPGIDELEALARLLDNIDVIRASGYNDDLILGGVLAVDYTGSNTLARDVRNRLRRQFGDQYLGEITRTVRVGESKARQRPVVLDQPECTAAVDYMAIATALAERIAA